MKRIFLVASLLWAGYTASAQVYVSVTGGYAWGVPSTKIGEESINGKESVRFGTFGEGINSQLRVGYFFNKTWGIDISAGYLYGEDQLVRREVSKKNIANTPLTATIDGEVKGRGRAFGAALSVIYNFTDNFYGRFGLLTKIGGKTEAIAHSYTTTNQDIPVAALARLGLSLPGLSGLPTSAVIKQGATIETSYTEDYKGKMPFGTIAAFGYKYNVTEKLAIFAELEYMNIAVKRDYSELREFNQTLKATISVAGQNRNVEVPLKTLDGFTNGSYNDVLRGQVYNLLFFFRSQFWCKNFFLIIKGRMVFASFYLLALISYAISALSLGSLYGLQEAASPIRLRKRLLVEYLLSKNLLLLPPDYRYS